MSEVLVVFGNCQAEAIAEALRHCPLTEGYTILYVPSFGLGVVEQDALLNDEIRTRCRLLFEQVTPFVRISDRVAFPIAQITTFPSIDFNPLWPLRAEEPRSKPELPTFPFGRYPYGDRIINEIVAEGLEGEEAWRAYRDRSARAIPDIRRLVAVELGRWRYFEKNLDVAMSDAVFPRVSSHRLFWTYNHPNKEVLCRLAARVLVAAGLAPQGEAEAFRVLSSILTWEFGADYHCPIHPEVAAALELTWWSPGMLYRRYNQMMPHEAFIRSQMAWDSPSLTHIGGEGRQTLVDRAPDDPISVAPGCAPRSNSPSASAAVVEAFRKVPAERRASVLIDLFHSTVPPDYGGFFVDRSKSEADQREQVLFELDGLVNAQSIGFAVEMIPLMYPYLQTLEGKDRYLEVLDVGSRTGAGAALLADIFMSYHSRLPTYVDTIDIDPTFHEYRSSRWPRLRQNLVGDVFSLSAKSYDIIVCSHTVEHLSEPIPFCRKLQAVAKNWVFIYCPYNEINPIPGHHTVNDALIDQLMPVEKRILPSWWWRPKGEPAECVFVVLPAD